jgi:TPR repeat protein
MRISEVALSLTLIALTLGFSPAVSFDGTPSPEGQPVSLPQPGIGDVRNNLGGANGGGSGGATPLASVPVAPMAVEPRPNAATPFEAFRSGTQALRAGRTQQALLQLQYAADQGVPAAQWKLGRMYADGQGVDKSTARAFEYFRRIVNAHADDVPGTPQARLVASAFVALGMYYLDGIPEAVNADSNRARELFRYAASYFGDADAQYQLGRLYLLGTGTAKDPIQAARWLRLAANKDQHSAQALLGTMLFKGEDVVRQAPVGLFWLTVAKDGAGPDEPWITEAYAEAAARASNEERALAYRYLENWLRKRRE